MDFDDRAGESFADGATVDFGAFSLTGTSSDLNEVSTQYGGSSHINGTPYPYLNASTDSGGNVLDTVSMSFATPTTAWGADFADESVVQMVLTFADSSTETIDVSPNQPQPGFFGFTSMKAVTSILFQANNPAGNISDGFGIDNVAGTSTVIPLPAALPLFAGGLGLLGYLGWRRKRLTVT